MSLLYTYINIYIYIFFCKKIFVRFVYFRINHCKYLLIIFLKIKKKNYFFKLLRVFFRGITVQIMSRSRSVILAQHIFCHWHSRREKL